MKLSEINNTDAKLVVAYQKFTTRTHQTESFAFWFDKGNNEAKYDKYIKPNAAKEINIADDLRGQFHPLAQAGNYAGMNALFVEARAEVLGMLEPRLGEFENSAEYKAYLALKKAGNITKALKLLGITGPNAKAMETLLKTYAVGDADDKRTALEKMNKLAKAEVVKAALKSSGLM